MNTELNQIEIKENQIAVVTNSEGYPIGCAKSIESIEGLINADIDGFSRILSINPNKQSMQYEFDLAYKHQMFEEENEATYTVTITNIYQKMASVNKYNIRTEVRTPDGKPDQSEAAKKVMKVTANVTKTKDELKDFMIQWQKHKAKYFPGGKVIVTSFTKKGELHEQYSLCETDKYQIVDRNDNPKFYLESTNL